jgi:ketopantoate reductase
MGIMFFVLLKVDLTTHIQALLMLIFFLDTVAKTPVDAAGHYDYVVCVHKAINQDAVAKSLVPVINDTTTIVLIQNGVGNEDPFRAQFPNCSILSCVVCLQIGHPPYEKFRLISIDLGWCLAAFSRNCQTHQV